MYKHLVNNGIFYHINQLLQDFYHQQYENGTRWHDMPILQGEGMVRVASMESPSKISRRKWECFWKKGWGTSFQETNIQVAAPENWGLDTTLPFGMAFFQVFLGGFLEANVGSATVILLSCALFSHGSFGEYWGWTFGRSAPPPPWIVHRH